MATPRKPQQRQRSAGGDTRVYAPTHAARAAADPVKKDKPGKKHKISEQSEATRRGQAAESVRRTQKETVGRAAPPQKRSARAETTPAKRTARNEAQANAKRPPQAKVPPRKKAAEAPPKKKLPLRGRGRQETVVVPIALLGLHPQYGAQAAQQQAQHTQHTQQHAQHVHGAGGETQAVRKEKKRGQRRKWFFHEGRAEKKRQKRAAVRDTLFYNDNTVEKKERERRPVNKKAVLTVLIGTLSTVVLLLCGWFLFLLDEVVVSGSEAYTPALITELSGLVKGRHMLLCDVGAARESIEKVPYIKVLSVERVFPRAIHISVQERKETAVILSQGYEVAIDMEGHVLSIGAAGAAKELIRVSGMSQHGYQVNKPMGAGDDMQAAILRDILKNLSELGLLSEVVEIDLSNPLRVSMRTGMGVSVLLGQADDLADKLMWMRDALPSLHASNISVGMLDVSAKAGPVFSPAQVRSPVYSSAPPEDETEPDHMDEPEPESTQTPEQEHPEAPQDE